MENEQAHSVTKLTKSELSSIAALFIFVCALSIYSENESQWFNSYVKNISMQGNFEVALMVSMSGVVGAIAFIIWGVISDNSRSKHGRRKPLLVIGAISTAIFVYLFGVSTNYLWLLICDGVIIAITSNMFHVTNRALIPDLWPTEKRGRINTIMFVGASVGSAFIWIYSLLLLPGNSQSYTRETHQMMFGFASIALIVSAIFIWFFIKEPKVTDIPKGFTKSIKDLFDKQEMVNHKDFLKMFMASLFTIMAQNAFKPYVLILLQEFSFNSTQIAIAAVLLIASIFAVIFFMLLRLDKVGRKTTTYIGLIVAPIGCIILGLSGGSFWFALIGLIIMFPFMLGLGIAVDTWTADLLPENERGKFLGIVNIVKAAGQAPGVLLAGYMADLYGTLAVFIVAAIFLLIGIPFFRLVPETLKPRKTDP